MSSLPRTKISHNTILYLTTIPCPAVNVRRPLSRFVRLKTFEIKYKHILALLLLLLLLFISRVGIEIVDIHYSSSMIFFFFFSSDETIISSIFQIYRNNRCNTQPFHVFPLSLFRPRRYPFSLLTTIIIIMLHTVHRFNFYGIIFLTISKYNILFYRVLRGTVYELGFDQ